MTKNKEPIVRCRNIGKHFGGVTALSGVDFSIVPGMVHGLVGENGAGKSTLMKVLAGVYRPDEGEIYMDGNSVSWGSADEAIKKRVITVHQDINLIPSMNAAENLFLNNEPKYKIFGLIKLKEYYHLTEKLLAKYGISIDPKAPVSSLPNDIRKMIQIIKAVEMNARVLLLDEPTSSLTDMELKVVLKLIRTLAERKIGVVFISHYLDEVFQVADDITIFRDGCLVTRRLTSEVDIDSVVNLMIGKSQAAGLEKRISQRKTSECLLSVKNLEVPGKLREISFDLCQGEILGLTGLSGSGLSDLARTLFGAGSAAVSSGSIMVSDRPVRLKHPADAMRNKMALLTNDRHEEGIFSAFTISENICLPIIDRFGFPLDLKAMADVGRRSISRLNIKASGPSTPIKQLSGGNQQKVLFAKWLETRPEIFILEEPTIGVDVGSKSEIREIIRNIADQGVGVILITAELDELEMLCDRVLVMFRGVLIREFIGVSINKDAILQASVSGI